MRLTRFLTFTIAFLTFSHICTYAQSDIVEKINSYGTFDRWCVREIKESGLIGGEIKYLYEFFDEENHDQNMIAQLIQELSENDLKGNRITIPHRIQTLCKNLYNRACGRLNSLQLF